MVIKINGFEYKGSTSWNISEKVGNVTSSNLQVLLENQARPEAGDLVEIFDDHGNRVFFGVVGIPQTPAYSSIFTSKIYSLNCSNGNGVLNRRIVNKSYSNATITEIVNDLFESYIDDEGITLGTISTINTPVFEIYNCKNMVLLDVLNELASFINGAWKVTNDKVFNFVKFDDFPRASQTVTANNAPFGALQMSESAKDLRTKQIIDGAYITSLPRAEYFDITERWKSCEVLYPIASQPVLLINGYVVSPTLIGIIGIDDENPDKLFLWKYDSSKIILNTNYSKRVLTNAEYSSGTYSWLATGLSDKTFTKKPRIFVNDTEVPASIITKSTSIMDLNISSSYLFYYQENGNYVGINLGPLCNTPYNGEFEVNEGDIITVYVDSEFWIKEGDFLTVNYSALIPMRYEVINASKREELHTKTGLSGLIENVVTDPTIKTQSDAKITAGSLLSLYGAQKHTIKCTTDLQSAIKEGFTASDFELYTQWTFDIPELQMSGEYVLTEKTIKPFVLDDEESMILDLVFTDRNFVQSYGETISQLYKNLTKLSVREDELIIFNVDMTEHTKSVEDWDIQEVMGLFVCDTMENGQIAQPLGSIMPNLTLV